MAKKKGDWWRIPVGLALMPFVVGVGWLAEIDRYVRQRWFS